MLKERKKMVRVKKRSREEAGRRAEETRVNSGETKGISEMMRKKMNTKKERETFYPCFFVFSESTCSSLSSHLPFHNPPTCQLASHLA